MNLRPTRLTVTGIQANALGANFTGSGTMTDWNRLHLDGQLDGLTVARAATIATDRPMPWNGTLAGDVSLDTSVDAPDTDARVNLKISPAPEGTAIEGRINAVYDQKAGQVFTVETATLRRRPRAWTWRERWGRKPRCGSVRLI